MTNLLAKLRHLIQQRKQSPQEQTMPEPHAIHSETAALNAEIAQNLMEMIDNTHEGMYSCEETFDLLDEYVELIVDEKEAAELMPYVKKHLDVCPDCYERYEILLNILQSESPAAP
jgi:hypothetical protein